MALLAWQNKAKGELIMFRQKVKFKYEERYFSKKILVTKYGVMSLAEMARVWKWQAARRPEGLLHSLEARDFRINQPRCSRGNNVRGFFFSGAEAHFGFSTYGTSKLVP
jgi:hypothetical protein